MIKLYLKFAVLLAVTAYVTAKDPKAYSMLQKLDHFDSKDTRIMLMRYLENDEFYQTGGPIFIYVGGREPLSSSNIAKGTQIYRMAKEHHGHLLHTEHRFFGESRPLETMTMDYFKYLNTKQALADLARFTLIMTDIHGRETSKIILVGCSSGGALATWFKNLYPDFVSGVWASSAALLATTDLSESAVFAGETIKKVGGVDCYNRIKEGIAELEEMFENKRGADIKAMFKLCDSFDETNSLDVSTLFFEISDIFFQLITNHKVDEIQKACTKLMQGSLSDLLGLAYYIAENLGGKECNELSYNANLNYLRNPSPYRKLLRQWSFQRCNEFGSFQAFSSSSQIFGTRLPLNYFVTLCADTFGDRFTKEYIKRMVKETNKSFGGLNPDVENVYWTNGELDPYRVLSVPSGPHATVIPNLTHCSDMHEITPEDSPELRASKEKLEGFVREWLAK